MHDDANDASGSGGWWCLNCHDIINMKGWDRMGVKI